MWRRKIREIYKNTHEIKRNQFGCYFSAFFCSHTSCLFISCFLTLSTKMYNVYICDWTGWSISQIVFYVQTMIRGRKKPLNGIRKVSCNYFFVRFLFIFGWWCSDFWLMVPKWIKARQLFPDPSYVMCWQGKKTIGTHRIFN